MSLQTRLDALISAIGADVKALQAAGGSTAYAVPSTRGARTKPFDPFNSLYNVTPTSMSKIRDKLADAETARVGVSIWGHSIMAGAFSVIGSTDLAAHIRRTLTGEGAPISGSGYIPVTNTTSPARDARWTTFTFTDANDRRYAWAYSMAANAVATLTGTIPGTIVDVPFIVGNGYGPVEVTIDGTIVETYDPAAGTPGALVIRSYTGLANVPHTVSLRSTTADPQGTLIIGVNVRQATGIEVSNHAMGGSKSADWLPTGAAGENYNISNNTSRNDIVLLEVTGNDMIQNDTVANSRANLIAILDALVAQGTAVILCVEPPGQLYEDGNTGYPAVTAARTAQWQSMIYDMADTYNVPLFDMYHFLVSYQNMNSLGWSGDVFHPNGLAYGMMGRTIAEKLFGTQPFDKFADKMLTEYVTSTPAAPATGVTEFTRYRARRMPAFIGPSGQDSQLQPALFSNRVAVANAINNATLPSLVGLALTHLSNGTGTPAAIANAGTNFYTAMVRYRLVTPTLTGSGAGSRSSNGQWMLSSTANKGGFFFVARFGFNAIAAASRAFIGLSATTTALVATSDPSAFLNQIGFGFDGGDTNLQFMRNDGSGVSTKVDLGANFAKGTGGTYFYEVRLFAPSGVNQVFWSAHRLNDGVVVQGGPVTTDLPAIDTLLTAHLHLSNGTGSGVQNLDVQSLYIETDN